MFIQMNQILISIGSVQYQYSGTSYLNRIGIESVRKCWIGTSLFLIPLFCIPGFSVSLLSLSILLHFFVYSNCDVICKIKETIRMQILAYFVSLFYHLNEFQNSVMGFYTTQVRYLHNKLRINFPCPPPFN